MSTYNGHRNYNHWNVSLWISNDEGLYNMALNMLRCYRRGGKAYAASKMLERLHDEGITHTPDGAPYSVTTITAALRDLS